MTATGAGSGDFKADGTVPMTGTFRLNGQWLSNDGGSEGLFVDTAGRVGVGTNNPNSQLSISSTLTQTAAGWYYGSHNQTDVTPAGASAVDLYGAAFNRLSTSSNDVAGRLLTGSDSSVHVNGGAGAILSAMGSISNVGNYSSRTITNAPGISINIHNNSAGGAITNAYGVNASITRSAGTIDTGYGVYVGTVNATNKYSFYANDSSASSYFAGRVGIATTAPAAILDVNGSGSLSSMLVPRDSTANRPTGINGMIRYNTNTARFEAYEGGQWVNMTATGAGSGDFKADGTVPMTGQLLGIIGTAATPSFTFNGDADTGMWRAGVDQLAFSTAGIKRVQIDNNGRVGVGTSSMTGRMQIYDSSTTSSSSGLVVSANTSVSGTASTIVDLSGTSTPSNNLVGINFSTLSAGGNLYPIQLGNMSTSGSNNLSLIKGGNLAAGGQSYALELGAISASGSNDAAFAKVGNITAGGNGNLVAGGALSSGPGYQAAAIKVTDLDGGSGGAYGLYVGGTPSSTASSPLELVHADSLSGGGNTYGMNTNAVSTSGASYEAALVRSTTISGGGTAYVVKSGNVSASGASSTVAGMQVGTLSGGANAYGFDVGNMSTTAATANAVAFRVGTVSSANNAAGLQVGNVTSTALNDTAYGLRLAQVQATGGGTTTAYGLYLGNLTGATRRSIFAADTSSSSFIGGALGLGNATATAGAVLDLNGTGSSLSSMIVPRDSTANRPTGINGMIRYNTNIARFEAYEGGQWVNMTAAGAGSGDFKADGTVPMTGQLLGIIGTAATPSFTFDGDPNTGMWNAGADRLAFSTGGVERMRITNTGNLGLGTDVPSQKFDVYGNASIGDPSSGSLLYITGTAGTQRSLVFRSGSDNRWTIQASTGAESGSDAGSDLWIRRTDDAGATTNAMGILRNSGYVGINTTVPDAFLTVVGTGVAENQLRLRGPRVAITSGNVVGGLSFMSNDTNLTAPGVEVSSVQSLASATHTGAVLDTDLIFNTTKGTSFSEKVRIAADGRVGIGTSSPNAAAALDINGTGNLSAVLVPRATTAERPVTAANGMIRYNTNTSKFEVYQAGNWADMATGSGGSGSIDALSDGSTQGGADNTFLGGNAGDSIAVGGVGNTAIGRYASEFLTTGDYNVAMGVSGLLYNQTGLNNVAIGAYAARGTAAYTGSNQNVFVGRDAGYGISSGALDNVGVGFSALANITSGDNNVAVGSAAGDGITTGQNNVAIGQYSLQFTTTENDNTAVGDGSGYKNQATNNTYFGARAGYEQTTGTDNVYIGFQSGFGGTNNVAGRNVAVGSGSGFGFTSGGAYDNVLIGYQAGDNITTGDRNIVLGSSIDAPSATASNQMTIGNMIFGTGINGTGTTISNGRIGIASNAPQAVLDIVGTGTASALIVPRDSTANRPTGVNGMIRYNTTSQKFEVFEGTWQNMVSSGGGAPAGGNMAIQYNDSGTMAGASGLTWNSVSSLLYVGGTVGVESIAGGEVGITNSNSTVVTDTPLASLTSGSAVDSGSVHQFIGVYASQTHTPTAAGNYISFSTVSNNTETATERMRIASNGSVGINTDSPSQSLHVHGNATIGDPSNSALLYIAGTAGTTRGLVFRSGADNRWTIQASTGAESGSDAGSDLWIRRTNDAGTTINSMAILRNSGYVGIGTTIPDSFLTIMGTGTAENQLRLRSPRAIIGSGSVIGGIGFMSNDTNLTAPGVEVSSVQAVTSAAHTASVLDTDLVFNTTKGTVFSEKMRIVGDGRVAIGTNTPDTGAVLDIFGTGAISALLVPRDTTANRPTGVNGMIRYNTNTGALEAYQSGSWSSLGGITSCPTGFTLVGNPGTRSAFCIHTDEQTAANYMTAVAACEDTTDPNLGNAHLCTFRQWHRACRLGSGINNMTGNWEMVDQLTNDDYYDSYNTQGALRAGNTTCDTIMDDRSITTTDVYRCCF